MDVAVIPKLTSRRPSRALAPSVLGRGLPERLRSTTVALIGLVAAAGLAMVGLTLQHALPVISSGPIHEPVESGVAPARALVERPPAIREAGGAGAGPVVEESSPASRPAPTAEAPPPAASPPSSPVVSTPPGSGNVQDGVGRKRAETPVEPSGEPAAAPVPAPAPVDEPVATPSRELPEPVAEEPVEEPGAVPGKGHAYGKGGGEGPEGAGPPGLAKR